MQLVSGDHLVAPLRGQGMSTLPAAQGGKSVIAQIELTRTTLYAFDFVLAD